MELDKLKEKYAEMGKEIQKLEAVEKEFKSPVSFYHRVPLRGGTKSFREILIYCKEYTTGIYTWDGGSFQIEKSVYLSGAFDSSNKVNLQKLINFDGNFHFCIRIHKLDSTHRVTVSTYGGLLRLSSIEFSVINEVISTPVITSSKSIFDTKQQFDNDKSMANVHWFFI